MTVTYGRSSVYADTGIIGSYLDILQLRNLPNELDDILFEVPQQYAFRPDLLANDLYGDSRLWWVFAVRNKDIIQDPIFDMIAGQKIYLPKSSTMNRVLGI
jgi:hypothetical protein